MGRLNHYQKYAPLIIFSGAATEYRPIVVHFALLATITKLTCFKLVSQKLSNQTRLVFKEGGGVNLCNLSPKELAIQGPVLQRTSHTRTSHTTTTAIQHI